MSLRDTLFRKVRIRNAIHGRMRKEKMMLPARYSQRRYQDSHSSLCLVQYDVSITRWRLLIALTTVDTDLVNSTDSDLSQTTSTQLYYLSCQLLRLPHSPKHPPLLTSLPPSPVIRSFV